MNIINKAKNFALLGYSFFMDDHIIGQYHHVKAKNHRVNMFDYQPMLRRKDACYNQSRYNLGDYLGFVITSWMLEKKGLSLDTWIPERRHLNTVGSSLLTMFQNATIWGSGVERDCLSRAVLFLSRYPLTRLDIRAVRGPLTRKMMLDLGHKCPETYGDPAILMPFIYNPDVKKCYKYSVIVQLFREEKFRAEHPEEHIISMNTDDYKFVIDEIKKSEIVYSSSLHGIILAEAYGVPAVFFRGLLQTVDFKYKDYYASTGRIDVHLSDTFEEALKTNPPTLPDLSDLQKRLLQTFPYDLWINAKRDISAR